VVSPHLDDAALSASVGIGATTATVVTVFAALPAPDMPASWWDRLTNAATARERQQDRLAEDRQAMRLLSAHGLYLDQPEALYRNGDPDLAGIAGQLTGLFEAADAVWLPAAIGGHRDHGFAREAGKRAAAAAGHAAVVLYADFPYVISYGWPAWVTGRPAEPYLDPTFWLADQLEAAGLDPAALTATVTRLSPQQRSVKAGIIAAYRTQAPALGLTATDLARDPAKLAYELSWRMPLRAGAT
jgi:hypothetical protein